MQRELPDARVVKAFNTIGNAYFVDPSFGEGKPTMLIAATTMPPSAPSLT
jgi:predicted dinucleotide-binding enzyme